MLPGPCGQEKSSNETYGTLSSQYDLRYILLYPLLDPIASSSVFL